MAMVMVAELREVFPYFPMPNYPWAHMTANVLHTMRREREVYMEGATRKAGVEEDVDMESAGEGMVPIESLDRKSTRLNSSHSGESRMPSSA